MYEIPSDADGDLRDADAEAEAEIEAAEAAAPLGTFLRRCLYVGEPSKSENIEKNGECVFAFLPFFPAPAPRSLPLSSPSEDDAWSESATDAALSLPLASSFAFTFAPPIPIPLPLPEACASSARLTAASSSPSPSRVPDALENCSYSERLRSYVNESAGSPVTTVVGSSPRVSRLRSRSSASRNSRSWGTENLRSARR